MPAARRPTALLRLELCGLSGEVVAFGEAGRPTADAHSRYDSRDIYLTGALRVMLGRMDLPGEQLLVEASAREQLMVGSLVDDPAAVHDHDRLGTGDRA